MNIEANVENTSPLGGKGKQRAVDIEDDEDPTPGLQYPTEDEDANVVIDPNDENWDEFTWQIDDEEVEDSDPTAHLPQADIGTSANLRKSVVPPNVMQCGGPGKPQSSIPTWLRANYTNTCEKLKKEMSANQSRRPLCYDTGRFIVEPPAPIFDPRTVQVSPAMFYQPKYFVWLPHLFHRIPCPSCKSAGHRTSRGDVIYLRVLSWPRMPRRVIDVDSHIYIIGQRYYCGDMRCKRTYQSWSRSILDAIPPSVASQLPFHLTYRSGLTDQLAALVRSSFGRGLGLTPFAE
jgi:hypothetical protein